MSDRPKVLQKIGWAQVVLSAAIALLVATPRTSGAEGSPPMRKLAEAITVAEGPCVNSRTLLRSSRIG